MPTLSLLDEVEDGEVVEVESVGEVTEVLERAVDHSAIQQFNEIIADLERIVPNTVESDNTFENGATSGANNEEKPSSGESSPVDQTMQTVDLIEILLSDDDFVDEVVASKSKSPTKELQVGEKSGKTDETGDSAKVNYLSQEKAESATNKLEFRLMPCEVVIPPLHPQYRYLLSPSNKAKRKMSLSSSSSLKKKMRSDVCELFPLGSKSSANQIISTNKVKQREQLPLLVLKKDRSDRNTDYKCEEKKITLNSNPKFRLYSKYGELLSRDGKISKENKSVKKSKVTSKLDKSKMCKALGFPYNEHSYYSPKTPSPGITLRSSSKIPQQNSQPSSQTKPSVSQEKLHLNFKKPTKPNSETKPPLKMSNCGHSSQPVTAEETKVFSVDENFIFEFAKRVSSILSENPSLKTKNSEPKPPCVKKCLRKQSALKRRVNFSLQHSFELIDHHEQEISSLDSLLPEPHVYQKIMQQHWQEFDRAKLSLLDWMNHWWTDSQVTLLVNESAIENDVIAAFENRLKKKIYSQLQKIVNEVDRAPGNSGTVDFFIDSFDVSDAQCWKIVLKRTEDSKNENNFAVGDITSIMLQTRNKDIRKRWKTKYIFGYTENVSLNDCDGVIMLTISLAVRPIGEEIKSDVAKVRGLVNIQEYLRLFGAVNMAAHSPLIWRLCDPISEKCVQDLDSSDLSITESDEWQAVDPCLNAIFSSKPSLYLINGAPGTGKTNYLIKLIQKLHLKKPKDSTLQILVITRSEETADDMCNRLVHFQIENDLNFVRYRVAKNYDDSLKKYVLDGSNYFLSKLNIPFDIELEKRLLEAKMNSKKIVDEQLDHNSVFNSAELGVLNKCDASVVANLKASFERQVILSSADVIVVSRDACYGSNFYDDFTPSPSNEGVFHKLTICIFDDAHEISESDLLIPIMTMVPNLILFGDSKNPSVSKDLSVSPFNRFLDRLERTNSQGVITLKTQYRMHPKIFDCLMKMKFEFSCSSPNNSSRFLMKPLMVIDLFSKGAVNDTDLYNKQAELCKMIVRNVQKLNSSDNISVGILVNTKKQKLSIGSSLASSPEILVEKANRYGGLEKDVIIVCFPTLLQPEKFFYAAMTRAKHSLIICGEFFRLKGQSTIDEMVINATRRKCFQRWSKDPAEFPFKILAYSR